MDSEPMKTVENTSGRRPGEAGGAGDAGSPGARRVILLVEDNADDRDLYGGLLWYNGYDVVQAEDGESALAKAAESRPDLVLLDLILPGRLSGLEVAAELRSSGFEGPIVVLSAVPREDHGSALERAGITAYVEKPVDPFVVVREVMRRVGSAGP